MIERTYEISRCTRVMPALPNPHTAFYRDVLPPCNSIVIVRAIGPIAVLTYAQARAKQIHRTDGDVEEDCRPVSDRRLAIIERSVASRLGNTDDHELG